MSKKNDFEEKEKSIREQIIDRAKRAIVLRSKDREFHGLEREFYNYQAKMIVEYDTTKDIKHPRDVGNARETILREFLNSGCLPKKYSVSSTSVRVASPSGHLSHEMDIVLYDEDELITLMNRNNVYEVYPVENTYGVIQVKSKLTTKELKSGLDNLRSYKKLNPQGFGILFSYCSDMNWDLIIKHLKAYADENPSEHYPNFIFILDRGFFAFASEGKAEILSHELAEMDDVAIHGFPDRQQQNLYQFQLMLLELCRASKTSLPQMQNYFSLPLTSEEQSYRFALGSNAEFGSCEEHGDYPRKISSESLTKITEWCEAQEPINGVKATHLAFGIPEDEEAYTRQPSLVYIYNPEDFKLSDILKHDNEYGEYIVPSIAYDIIITNDMCIWLPYYYSIKEELIPHCPKCPSPLEQLKVSE
ncbi:hypothetical protein SAMN02745753_04084 [Marinomonas polaris DSM 16579]|uniref:DUF6602 domain-containing protein n=1 Tax=Marinomonas polaris DSM 16579 TaxID=1122206 RepID=A0A1M5KJH3_9GAMM|nr:DUF6602 domain-containing protein [Marinomonas polaris]SHG52976.1 hypothetical protein SAMN02745753_04084 [Marinomonas polaris DSM 16579]